MFGNGLATATAVGATVPLPTQLAGTSVKITDRMGTERLAPLFFVAATQVNYLISSGTAAGTATATITTGNGSVFTEGFRIANVAPALFGANPNGQGVAAAVVLRIKADKVRLRKKTAESPHGVRAAKHRLNFAQPTLAATRTTEQTTALY